MKTQIVVDRSAGVANVYTKLVKAGGRNGGLGNGMKPIDKLRREHQDSIFGKSSPIAESANGTEGNCDRGNGRKKEPKMNKKTRLAREYHIPAMHLHITKIKPFRVAQCCEKAATVLFTYAKIGELPGVYRTWQQQREAAESMGPEATFAYLAGAYKDQNEKLALFTLAAAASVGRIIAMSPQGEPLYGKTPEQWSELVKALAIRFATEVENEYSRMQEQKAREWKTLKQD